MAKVNVDSIPPIPVTFAPSSYSLALIDASFSFNVEVKLRWRTPQQSWRGMQGAAAKLFEFE